MLQFIWQKAAVAQTSVLNASALAPGVYFYTVYANGEMLTKKMVNN